MECIDGVTGSYVPVLTRRVMQRRRRRRRARLVPWVRARWQFKPVEANVWVEKDILIELDYKMLVEREDARQAALAGLQSKFLTQSGVGKRLGDCGFDSESASHTQINQLSGGMKVKIVLAGDVVNPHVLILDEQSEEGQPAALPEEDRWQAPERSCLETA